MAIYTDLDIQMKQGESYKDLKVPRNNYCILRIDGRAFHTHTKEVGYERPFDITLHQNMLRAMRMLTESLNAKFGYTQSDEISILLERDFDIYDRRIEKLLSLSSSIVTAGYNQTKIHFPLGFFDSRIWISGDQADVYRYFEWRMKDSWRNCVSASAYWAARNQGMNKTQATRATSGPILEKHEFLHSLGINAAKLEGWKKNGTAVFWVDYSKEGYNPIKKEKVLASRRALIEEPPNGNDIQGWLRNRLFDVAMIDRSVVESQVPDFSGW